MTNNNDEKYMAIALELAEKGRGTTNPNPMVGAVLVQDNRIIARGWHKRPGTPHAEAIVLEKAGVTAEGATLYVNLEPCCHRDKQTPPCADGVIAAKVARVVVGMLDPNPKVNGKGVQKLRDAGLSVDVGVLKEKAEALNVQFARHITTSIPYVTLKVGQTLDGKIATATGESKWITGAESRKRGHILRNEADAIMVGIGTLMKDDPSLTTRLDDGATPRDPHRVILDSHLRIPLDAKVLNLKSKARTYIATTINAPTSKMKELKKKKAELLIIDPDKDGRVSLPLLMDELVRLGMVNVLIEGGARINAAALRAGVVDRVMFFIAPKLLGGDNARSSIGGGSPEFLDDAIKLTGIKHTSVGDDILIEGYIKKSSTGAQESDDDAADTDESKPSKKRKRRRSSRKKSQPTP